jgi:predicted secreted protein
MATQAIFALGTLLKIGDGGGPETFTTIAEVMSISGPGLTSDTIDVTSHSSTGGFREFIMGLSDGGEVTFTINYNPTQATHNATTGLLRDYINRTRRNFKIVFPDGSSTTWSFTGVVTGFSMSAPTDAQLSADVTIKVSGAPTLV